MTCALSKRLVVCRAGIDSALGCLSPLMTRPVSTSGSRRSCSLSAFPSGGVSTEIAPDPIWMLRYRRSLKYEDVFIKAYGSVAKARRGVGGRLRFYNEERLHQALGYRTPRAVFDGDAHEPVDNDSALEGYGVAHRLVRTELSHIE